MGEKRKMEIVVEACANSGIACPWRFLLWVVFRLVDKNAGVDTGDALAGLHDLHIQSGDAGLDSYVTSYTQLSALCKEPLSEQVQRYLLLREFRRAPMLGRVLQRSEEFSLGAPERSFQWLWAQALDKVDKRRKELQRTAYTAGLKSNSYALPAKGGAKGSPGTGAMPRSPVFSSS